MAVVYLPCELGVSSELAIKRFVAICEREGFVLRDGFLVFDDIALKREIPLNYIGGEWCIRYEVGGD